MFRRAGAPFELEHLKCETSDELIAQVEPLMMQDGCEFIVNPTGAYIDISVSEFTKVLISNVYVAVEPDAVLLGVIESEVQLCAPPVIISTNSNTTENLEELNTKISPTN